MKFQENLKYPAMVFSGTKDKDGKKVFFADGIRFFDKEDANLKEINKYIPDARALVTASDVEACFYAIEQTNSYTSFSKYKTIHDIQNRLGYYGVSLFVPKNKKAPTNIAKLLTALLDLYWQKYILKIEINKALVKVKPDIVEEPSLFTNLTHQPQYELDDSDYIQQASHSNPVAMQYKDEEQVNKIINNYLHETIIKYSHIYLINENEKRIQHNFNKIAIPDLSYQLKITAPNTEILKEVKIINPVDNKNINPVERTEYFINIYLPETTEIIISYKEKNKKISKEEIQNLIKTNNYQQQIEYSLPFNLIRGDDKNTQGDKNINPTTIQEQPENRINTVNPKKQEEPSNGNNYSNVLMIGLALATIIVTIIALSGYFSTTTSSQTETQKNIENQNNDKTSSFIQSNIQYTIDSLLQRTDFHNCIEDIKKLQLLSKENKLQHFLVLCKAIKTARENIEKGTETPDTAMIHAIVYRNPSDSTGKDENKTQHPNYQFLTKKQQEVLTAYTEILRKMANKENGYNVKNKQELKKKFDSSKKTGGGNGLKNKNSNSDKVTNEENKIKEYFTTIGIDYPEGK